MKLPQRGYAAQPVYPGTLGQDPSGVEQRPSGPFRPHNTAWTPAQSSLDAYATQRIGGHNPGLGSHIDAARKVAASISQKQYGWGTTHMLHADPIDRVRHMRKAGLSDEHINEWGEDTWNTATHIMRQNRHHKGENAPIYDTGPRDVERFDNQYED